MIVYGLIDSRTRCLRYVGQTVRALEVRLHQHAQSSKKMTTPPINAWLRGLQSDDAQPIAVELELCDSREELDQAEIFWIAYAKSIGCELLNRVAGGSQRSGWHHSASAKQAMSEKRKGKPSGITGYRYTDEQLKRAKERMSRIPHWTTTKSFSAESRAKMRKSRLAFVVNHPEESQSFSRKGQVMGVSARVQKNIAKRLGI